MDDALEAWSEFNVAMVGATAALAGLVIVAMSVNITKIIALPTSCLSARVASGIVSLLLALIVSALSLMPKVSAGWFGAVLIIVAVAAVVFNVGVVRKIFGDPAVIPGARIPKSIPVTVPAIVYLAGAIAVALDHPAGLYLLAAGCVLAIISAIVISWIALVEVLR